MGMMMTMMMLKILHKTLLIDVWIYIPVYSIF